MGRMTVSERFQAAFAGQEVDRLPVVEWATWWDLTLSRWRTEGLPVPDADPLALAEHFDLDLWWQVWTCAVHWECPWQPRHHGAGILSTAPDLDAVLPFVGRWPVDGNAFERGFALRREGRAAVWFTFPGFFWGPREILGIERHLTAFYDEPEAIHRINQALVDGFLVYLEALLPHGTPDFMSFAEDLSYNHGPMLGEATFREFLLPYYRQIVPRLRELGIRVVADSDGDITRCAPWFEEAGIEGVLPLERQAGVDVLALQSQNPRLTFIGGFDKMTMTQGPAAVRAEFERLRPAIERGRFLPSCDHQTPPGVSLAQYLDYLQAFREAARWGR